MLKMGHLVLFKISRTICIKSGVSKTFLIRKVVPIVDKECVTSLVNSVNSFLTLRCFRTRESLLVKLEINCKEI